MAAESGKALMAIIFPIIFYPNSCRLEDILIYYILYSSSGFRGVVTISNKRNTAADFSWKIVNGKDGTSFSIRPSKGTQVCWTINK